MKRELDKLKSEMDDGRGRGGGGGGGGALADQATHLQAENTALIKSMQGTYIQYVLFSHDKSLRKQFKACLLKAWWYISSEVRDVPCLNLPISKILLDSLSNFFFASCNFQLFSGFTPFYKLH